MGTFFNANHAFNYYWDVIPDQGRDFDNTKAMFNVGFYIQNPLDNKITNPIRNWKEEYAEAEWQWYLSGDRNIEKLGKIYGKIPPIWERMADQFGRVNSNYGWQWMIGNQLDYIVEKLKSDKDTRHAVISIYDGKENVEFEHDTPCTCAIHFHIIEDKLCMSVMMRSNDLWYGFCNDQYCFSKLQEMIAKKLKLPMGWYYHYASNMHIYNDKLDKR